MADITYTQFPIEADIVDISQMQTDISNAQTDILNLGQNKADKTTTINGYSLASNRTIYLQDIGSRNLLDLDAINFINGRNSGDVVRTKASDGTGVKLVGTATASNLWANPGDDGNLFLPQGNYTVSFEAVGTGSASVEAVGVFDSNEVTYYSDFTVPAGGMRLTTFLIKVAVGVTYDCTVYILLRPSSAPSTYVPYAKTNVELTNDYEEGTWTPHLYDYETKIMNLGTAYYTRIGRFVFYCYSQANFTPSSAISIMMQIRNFPFTGNIWGGGIYIGNITGSAGDKTIQATTNALYIRPNLTLNANTNYGAFTFWAFGMVS